MSYQQITLGDAVAALAQRLNDTGYVRWTQAELRRYWAETLRTWGALTSAFAAAGTFTTTTDQWFYALQDELPDLCGFTITDRDLITDLQYALLETPGIPWVGSSQFTLDDVAQAVQRRRDQFLLETGIVVTRSELPIAAPMSGRYQLPQTVGTIRRLAWVTLPEQRIYPLMRSDEWSFAAFSPTWVQNPKRPNQTWPVCYSVGVTPPLVVQIAPPPIDSGTLDLVSVNRGAGLDPASVATSLGVPDNWVWVVKWGALADLLNRDGLALDAPRAAYCEARWQQGLELAKQASTVLSGRVDDVVLQPAALADIDAFDKGWQGRAAGRPKRLMLAGNNLVALAPKPDTNGGTGQYSVFLDVVRNAPVPVSDGEFLPVGRQYFDAIMDYAQHIALFKEGPGQTDLARSLLERFLRFCGVNSAITNASVPDESAMLGQTRQDERQVARMDGGGPQ